jgi:hypothetical protein
MIFSYNLENVSLILIYNKVELVLKNFLLFLIFVELLVNINSYNRLLKYVLKHFLLYLVFDLIIYAYNIKKIVLRKKIA